MNYLDILKVIKKILYPNVYNTFAPLPVNRIYK